LEERSLQITVTGHGIESSEALRGYIEDKLARMDRYASRISRIQVILKPAPKDGRTVEAICHVAGGKPVVVRTDHTDFYAAVDLVADKLQRQLTKFKSRREKRVRRGQADEARQFKDAATGSAPPEEVDDYDLLGDEE
jgi:putative sigma-54 modulation protein